MPVFHPRNRLVNFRLSEEEFEQLRLSSASSGARSLSDFARTAVMRCVGQAVPAEPRPEIENKVQELEVRVTELVSLITALKREASEFGDRVEIHAGEDAR